MACGKMSLNIKAEDILTLKLNTIFDLIDQKFCQRLKKACD